MNPQVVRVLGDRLHILNVLEAAVEQSPSSTKVYHVAIEELYIDSDPNNLVAHLEKLTEKGVATFIVPTLNEWDFWNLSIRVKDLNLAHLRAERDSIVRELGQMKGESSEAIVPLGTQSPEEGGRQEHSGMYWLTVGVLIGTVILVVLAAVAIYIAHGDETRPNIGPDRSSSHPSAKSTH